MTLITDKPEGLPSGNALDDLVDPDEPQQEGERAEIYLSGAHVCTLANAPGGLGRITLMVELEVKEEAVRFTENGETEIPIRRCKRIGDMWLPGETRPPSKEEIAAEQKRAKAQAAAEKAERDAAEMAEREHNEPPMFDEDGDPIVGPCDRVEGDGIVDAEVIEDDDEDGDADNVVQFSDGGKK